MTYIVCYDVSNNKLQLRPAKRFGRRCGNLRSIFSSN